MHPKDLLSSKITVVLLVVLLAFLANLKFKQWLQQREVNKLKSSLEQQANDLLAKNQQLTNSITYLNSDDFKEQVARQQLNLKKDGELVYNFTENNIQINQAQQAQSTELTNPQKWWNYFFKPN